ncbi:hypothetical protein G7054_g11350 [Neopestalotiopsis clavispora]|nr:hypothetical protein G7054_g11350 [Neopestalotiopsis clavispora]
MASCTQHSIDSDITIIGAGMSGINIAYHIHSLSTLNMSYTILESRPTIGGTWDLFRYPGIRTDSDVHTFGFSWNPWDEGRPLASGQEIMDYMKRSAELHGIDKRIKFNQRVISANWNSTTALWTLVVSGKGIIKKLSTKFLILGTGYYDYENPLKPDIPGLESFKGPVVNPQFWPEMVDYHDKHVVVIGSGATAITLVPSLVAKARLVSMLQRSPSYILNLPSQDVLGNWMRKFLPTTTVRSVNRVRWLFLSWLLLKLCRSFPSIARFIILRLTRRELSNTALLDQHFKPSYDPWEQRMCFCPDGDFYAALRSGKAQVITDHIEDITAEQILLSSGSSLKPDIIVTATGLNLKFGGGIVISVDGEVQDLTAKFMWRNALIQDVPNLCFLLGYFTAPYTLGSEVTSKLLVRMLNLMQQKGMRVVVPHLGDHESLYTFVTLFVAIGYQCMHPAEVSTYACQASAITFSKFTTLTYWGLAFYFLFATIHTFTYARWKIALLDKWPRPLQILHSFYYTTITTLPFVVTIVYWAVLYTNGSAWYPTAFEAWSNLSKHGLNSLFALFEVVVPRTAPAPIIHIPWLLIILALYLGLAYITRAAQGFYVYRFLDPNLTPHGLVAAYVFGIAGGTVAAFFVIRAVVRLRKWLTEERLRMDG